MAHNYDTAEHYSDLSAKRVYLSGAGATIYAVVNTGATEPIQLDASGAWIGLATVNVANTVNSLTTITNTVNSLATVTLGASQPTIYAVVNTGEVALATVAVGSSATIYAVVNTSAVGQASVVLDAGTNYVGLASVNIGGTLPALAAGVNQIGSVTVSSLGAGVAQVGSVTVSSVGAGVAQIGSVTVSSIKAGTDQIGSVTVSNWNYPQTGYTVFAGTYSASGFNTVFTPATNTHFYVKDLVLSSLGTSWVGIKSGATNTPIFPTFTFNPAGGAVMNFGDSGLRSLATSDAFVLDLQGEATVSMMANVRFGN